MDEVLAFGPFRLLPAQRLLLVQDRPVRLGSRALEILIILVARAGQLVSHQEITAKVWPSTIVEESGLRVHLSTLRKALGESSGNRFIINVPAQGYRFVAPVVRMRGPVPQAGEALSVANVPTLRHRASSPLTRMIGREGTVEVVKGKLDEYRFVTIVGAGGMGKTTVARALMNFAADDYKDGVFFVDLSPVTDSSLVASTIAVALGIAALQAEPLQSLIDHLRDRQILVVLDNCEHLVEAVAALAEKLLHDAVNLTILSTSREALRARDEWVYRLQPLAMPAASVSLSAADALVFASIELFAERARASMDAFELVDSDVTTTIDLVRKLDGIPLAIELAAASVETFGLRGLARELENHFEILSRGRRTAVPRHQTLGAALDWSYEILSAHEKAMFRRLAIFKNEFTLDMARQTIVGGPVSVKSVAKGIDVLVAKSLVTADVSGEVVQYRLLETARSYGLDKLSQSGEWDAIAAQHAACCSELCEVAAEDWDRLPHNEWQDIYGGKIDDVRAALTWAFSPQGDIQTGFQLTAKSAYFWFRLSLMEEYLSRITLAVQKIGDVEGTEPFVEMVLYIALGQALWHARSTAGSGMAAAFTRAFDLAEELRSPEHKLQALWGLWTVRNMAGDYQAFAGLIVKFRELVEGPADDKVKLIADRMLALSYHFLGDQVVAWRHTQAALSYPPAVVQRARNFGFQLDQQFATRTMGSRILWIRGLADQAMATAEERVAEARAANHSLLLCYVLAQAACPIAIWSGDDAKARCYVETLKGEAEKHSLSHWEGWGRCFEVALKAGEQASQAGTVVAGLGHFIYRHLETMATLNVSLVSPELVANAERSGIGWCTAEIIRSKGEELRRQGDDALAEECFRRAIDVAIGQGALSWRLRAATSLARLLRDHGRTGEACPLLSDVYSEFTEGFATADLIAAGQLMTELGCGPVPRRHVAR